MSSVIQVQIMIMSKHNQHLLIRFPLFTW